MDLFKFTTLIDSAEPPPVGHSSSDPVTTTLEYGVAVNGWSRLSWIERYSAPGEFTLEARVSSGLANFLPLGTLLSHIATTEVMIVENHEITEKLSEDPIIKITGRSFVSFLENRVVGVFGTLTDPITPYSLVANYTWVQAVTMINTHISGNIDNMSATYTVSGTGVSTARTIPHAILWDEVDKLLKIDNLGIRTIRRNPWGVLGSSTESQINIYKGVDKTSQVMFSWVAGDIAEAQYLFSQKNKKNLALVVGKWVKAAVQLGTGANYFARWMIVDGSKVDDQLTAMPTGTPLTNTILAMQTLGLQALAAQTNKSITQIDLSQSAKPQYRTDYNLGDLVLIEGNYGAIATKQVKEYAEIEDENGVTGHPTLSDPGV
jgi:hypothetical protein